MKVKQTPKRLNRVNIVEYSSTESSESSEIDAPAESPDSSSSTFSEEEPSYETETLTSPYELEEFISFKSHCVIDDKIQRELDLLRADNIGEFDIKERIPWHIPKSAAFIIDPTTFVEKSDITIDCWTWELTNTYKCSVRPDENGDMPEMIAPVRGDNMDYFRIVKRNYICKENGDLKKRITTILKPGRNAKRNSKGPFAEVDNLILLQYMYPSENPGQLIPPSTKPRTYGSVKAKLKENLNAGKSVKKATFQTESDVGGFENVTNSSFLPSRNQARYLHDKERNANVFDDPLRELIEKQHLDPFKFVRKVETDGHSFSIFLIADNQLNNIANFCTTDNGKWKSELSWDFTFKLGRFDVLVLTYRNTSLLSKRTKRSPSMLGGWLICHQRKHEVVKVACDQLISLLPGLKHNIKVNVCDGEKAIINNVCEAFPSSLLLLCTRHVEGNVREYLPLLPQVQKNEILSDIFHDEGIIGSVTFEEFEERKQAAYEKWKKDYGCEVVKNFIGYFEKNKAEEFKFHLMKGVVNAADLNGNPDKVYNNNLESLNNVIKKWQANQEVDLYQFVSDMEELVKCQDSEVFRAFTKNNGAAGNSTYCVHSDFQEHVVDFNQGYACLSNAEKKEKTAKCVNWLVDPVKYTDVTSFNVGTSARATARENISSLLVSNPAIAPELQVSNVGTGKNVDRLASALPHVHIDVVRDMVRKAGDIADSGKMKEIVPSTEWWVKSSSRPNPHVVRKKLNGSITCDSTCQGFRIRSVCAHTIAVAFIQNAPELEKYLSRLKQIVPSLTKSASSKISNEAGKKKTSKKTSGSSAKRTYVTNTNIPPKKRSTIPSNNFTPMRTFCLKELKGNISTCFGCALSIVKIPYEKNFVIVYRDDRFTYGKSVVEKLQNVHFHLDVSCVIKKYPEFQSELTVPSHLQLTVAQIGILEKDFKLDFA